MNENETNRNDDLEAPSRTYYDGLFKQVMTDLFYALHIMVKTEQEVTRKPRTIDVAITCTQTDIEKARRFSPFDFLRKNNVIAFKSIKDPLTIWEYHKTRARTHFYIAENKLDPKDTIICAVCASEPRKVLHESQDTVEFTMIEPWHYVSNEKIPFHVIIIRKLPMKFKYYPLLLFAPLKKFKEFVKHAIDNNRLEYIDDAYTLHPKETKEVLIMAGKFAVPEENVKFIVNDLTPERILPYINVEDLLRSIDVQNLLRGIDVQDRLRGIDVQDLLRSIDVQNLLRGIDVQDRLRGIDVQDRLHGLSLEELRKIQNFLNDKLN